MLIKNEHTRGMVLTLAAVFIVLSTLTALVRKKGWNAFAVSSHPAWNLLFWASVASLLLALGIPFSLKWETLLNYTGPFRQFRAVGRFVFPFYYIMTITSFYLLGTWYRKSGWRLNSMILPMPL